MSLRLVSSNTTGSERWQNFEDRFSGYHRICLEPPYQLDHVSHSFCTLLGYSAEELQLRFGGDYCGMVHEGDRDTVRRCLDNLAEAEQTIALRYRLLKKDGTILPVCGTASSWRLDDGKCYAFAIVAEVSYWPDAVSFGDQLSALLPYGYLQCTCEKYPQVTYINPVLSDYLGLHEQPNRWEENAKENIYFTLPFEEREPFRLAMQQAQDTGKPVQLDQRLYRSDGTRVHLSGWLSLIPGESGKPEFAILYRPADEAPVDPAEPVRDTSYFPVLKRAYNAIFELDLDHHMVECIHGLDESPIGSLSGIQMTLDSARHVFLTNYVFPEDRNMMAAYFDQVCDLDDDWNGRTVLQADFRLKTPSGTFRLIGVAVHLEPSQVLLCCRDVTHQSYPGAQALENKTLHTIYDWMDFLSTSKEGTVGLLMLDETPTEGCSLLYGSSSVLHYLGLDTEDSPHRSTPPSLSECLAAADLTKEEFDEMVGGKLLYLWSRSAPDAFQFQLTCKTYHRGDRTLYIIWCDTIVLEPEPEPEPEASTHRVFARTFGHFDLFLDNAPITFSNAKEKELMALLIDRNGGTLASGEAISYLWPDEAADDRVSARYRKLAMGLKRTLEKYGIGDILINHNGVRSIDTAAIHCDYYELLSGNPKYRQAFHNAYMSDYSWSEETLATIWVNEPAATE
jgi:PAS domain S-box-containing protein